MPLKGLTSIIVVVMLDQINLKAYNYNQGLYFQSIPGAHSVSY